MEFYLSFFSFYPKANQFFADENKLFLYRFFSIVYENFYRKRCCKFFITVQSSYKKTRTPIILLFFQKIFCRNIIRFVLPAVAAQSDFIFQNLAAFYCGNFYKYNLVKKSLISPKALFSKLNTPFATATLMLLQRFGKPAKYVCNKAL